MLEQQLAWSSSAVPADGPLDLSIFDLDTLTATGNITITAGDNVLVKASMNAAGDTSEIAITSTGGDVTVGGDMPEDPMIFDMIHLKAAAAIDIAADGDVIIGGTATLITGSKTSGAALSAVFGDDVAISAGGQVVVNGAVNARDNVSVMAGTDARITSFVSAGGTGIEVFAGEAVAGNGNVFIHKDSPVPVDEVDINDERPTIGGFLNAAGLTGLIHLKAGDTSGNVSLLDAHLNAHEVVLDAPAGMILQPAGIVPEGEVPETGGKIISASISLSSGSDMTLENLSTGAIEAAITGIGNMVLKVRKGTLTVDELILTDIRTFDGSITIEVTGMSVNVVSVQSLTDSDNNDISITVLANSDSNLELHLLDAGTAGDVFLNIQGLITHPDGELTADRLDIQSWEAVALNTSVNALLVEISGNGGLGVNNTSAELLLEDIQINNGSVSVLTEGNMTAQNVVITTDWNTNTIPPQPNIVTLETEEGSGGTITVIHISAGTYATNQAEVDQLRLDMLNLLLREIPTAGIPAGFLTDGTDLTGDPVTYVELTLPEANDLSTIVADSFINNGTLMTATVAYLMYTRVFDVLGLAWSETYGAPPAGGDTLVITGELNLLFTMAKNFSSFGEIELFADGSVKNQTGTQTGVVNLIADSLTIEAQGSIHGIATAVNKIKHLFSASTNSINIVDYDGFGELNAGLQITESLGGPVSITSQGHMVVDSLQSPHIGAAVRLESVAGNLYVDRKDVGNTIVANGVLSLISAGDLIVTGHLETSGQIEFRTGGYLTTLGNNVELKTSSLLIDAASTVTLDGYFNSLESLDINSGGNVNLLGPITGRGGFTVAMDELTQQMQYLDQLENNLNTQMNLLLNIGMLAKTIVNTDEGQMASLDTLGDTNLQQLVRLPYDIQRQQVSLHIAGFANLLIQQDPLPDTINDMPGYYSIVNKREDYLQTISLLQGLIDTNTVQILRIAGDVDDLNVQLQQVRDDMSSQNAYQNGLTGSCRHSR